MERRTEGGCVHDDHPHRNTATLRQGGEHVMPEAVQCANPACPQTFWRWRASDPQRFCSRVCARQMHRPAPRPSRPARAPLGRPKPGVAEAMRRRWALWHEQRAHDHALRLLAEAGLGPPDPEESATGDS